MNGLFEHNIMKRTLLFTVIAMCCSVLHAQKFEWATSFGGPLWDIGKSVCTDADGNVYTTGYFNGNDVDIDPGEGTHLLSSEGDKDIFIQKLDVKSYIKPRQEKIGESKMEKEKSRHLFLKIMKFI